MWFLGTRGPEKKRPRRRSRCAWESQRTPTRKSSRQTNQRGLEQVRPRGRAERRDCADCAWDSRSALTAVMTDIGSQHKRCIIEKGCSRVLHCLSQTGGQHVPLTGGTFDLSMWHSVCSEGGVHEAVKPPSRRAVLGIRKTRGLVGTSLGFPHIPVRLNSINIYR